MIATEEGTVTGTTEAMTGTDMMTTEAMTIIVKAITDQNPMSEYW